jgi:hypothetical protein
MGAIPSIEARFPVAHFDEYSPETLEGFVVKQHSPLPYISKKYAVTHKVSRPNITGLVT